MHKSHMCNSFHCVGWNICFTTNKYIYFLLLSKGVWSLQVSPVERGVLPPGPWPHRADVHREGSCAVLLTAQQVTYEALFHSDTIVSTSSSLQVVQCVGPANGSSGLPCQRPASWATAGPGSVVPSGRCITRERDSAESGAEGKTGKSISILYLRKSMVTCV